MPGTTISTCTRWVPTRRGSSASMIARSCRRSADGGDVRNWAGNHRYRMRSLHEPESVEELQEVVRAARSLRVIGTGHSFNDLADSRGDAISLRRLPTTIDIDRERRTVAVGGPATYVTLCQAL